MVFSSHIFLFYFLPVVLLVYYALLGARVSLSWLNLFITIVSYVFYAWFEPWFVILMWVSTLVDFSCGKLISKPGASRSQRLGALYASMIVNLGMLGFFKYYMFFMGGVNRLAELFGAGSNLFNIMNIALPIGISFYTFQTMSYTIDVYRGDAPAVKNLRTFSCFVALFPQLIAGPIIRYNTVAQQLSKRDHTLDKFTSGVAIFILGLAKKIILANAAGQIADGVFAADSPGFLGSWWGILAYHFQIYFDFCGYSDMAVGLGRMLGFEFIKNFNAPYHSRDITDFWRRWHISLSTFIRDYLYIPLGGNRKGVRRTYINLIVAFFLSGLWHGAQMTFVLWGVFHGAMLIWERVRKKESFFARLPKIPSIILTNIVVLFIWVTFRAPDLGQMAQYWASMVGLRGALPSTYLLYSDIFSASSILMMLMIAVFVWQPFQAHEWVKKLDSKRYAVLLGLFFLAIVTMFTQTFNPFLYFQF